MLAQTQAAPVLWSVKPNRQLLAMGTLKDAIAVLTLKGCQRRRGLRGVTLYSEQ